MCGVQREALYKTGKKRKKRKNGEEREEKLL